MELNKVIKELKRGNNIEKNLTVYGNALAKSYYNMSIYMLAMNLSSNYDLIEEEQSADASVVKELFKKVVDVIDAVIVNDDLSNLSEHIRTVFGIRDEIIRRTDMLDEYTYMLQIYEHLLNRAEFRFKNYTELNDLDDFKDEVMIYISGSNNAELINQRIQMVMGELPVRLTTARFFDMMRSCSQCYVGVRNDMAEEYFDHIRECARPINMDNLNPGYAELYNICQQMLALDIENISQEDCTSAVAKITSAGQFIAANLKVWLYLIDIVNDLLIVMITAPYVMTFSGDMKKAATVIKEVLSAEKKGTFLRPDEDIVGLLTDLTDRQPVYQGEHMMLEDALYVVISDHHQEIDTLLLGDLYKELQLCVQLAAVTVFAKLDERQEYFTIDKSWLNKQLAQTENHFEEVFKGLGRPFKRAIMALAFSCMPVVFDRLDDMAEYLVRSLEGCRDRAERAACIDILRDIMAENS